MRNGLLSIASSRILFDSFILKETNSIESEKPIWKGNLPRFIARKEKLSQTNYDSVLTIFTNGIFLPFI